MPFKIVTDMKKGKKRNVEEKLYPGYLLVQADLENPEDPTVIKARHDPREVPTVCATSIGEPASRPRSPRPKSTRSFA